MALCAVQISAISFQEVLKMSKKTNPSKINSFSPDQYPVLIPYKVLESLAEAASEMPQLRIEIKRLREQQSALRNQFTEVMEKLSEL